MEVGISLQKTHTAEMRPNDLHHNKASKLPTTARGDGSTRQSEKKYNETHTSTGHVEVPGPPHRPESGHTLCRAPPVSRLSCYARCHKIARREGRGGGVYVPWLGVFSLAANPYKGMAPAQLYCSSSKKKTLSLETLLSGRGSRLQQYDHHHHSRPVYTGERPKTGIPGGLLAKTDK